MRALGEFKPLEKPWRKDDGFVDPFRPTLEVKPFASQDEVTAMQRSHLARVAKLFEETDVFVFTLGLTETWVSLEDNAVFPVAPGVSGGRFTPKRHGFLNLTFSDCRADLRRFIEMMRSINGNMRFLLTVSPVPLMATASGQQVIVATTYSKSVLRAVAGQMADNLDYVDYFPSYEIISSHVMGGQFYEADKRGVEMRGVDHVMAQFFAEHKPPPRRQAPKKPAQSPDEEEDRKEDILCDEELLAALGPKVTP